MDRLYWKKIKGLFHQAMEVPAEDREGFLKALGHDTATIKAVLTLCVSEPLAPTFDGPLQNLPISETQRVGERFGPFELCELIGQGGMGKVYRARRVDGHYDQDVALKLLHPHRANLDSQAISEHRLLAKLQHTNIARLVDAGISDNGEPFFAMELVDGLPLFEFCQSRKLPLDERLQLFEEICEAVAHAHRALVLHRDLKPDNILVTNDGRPKLLDFGIARLLEESSGTAASSTATQQGLYALTPEYASPEQIRGEPLTTATDVYALGIILYQLLSGNRPYEFSQRGAEEIVRVVTTSDIPLPSSRAAINDIPSRRLRGDLDRITMTALHRDSERRYGTARQLADDITKFRKNQPIAARADSLGYRLRKLWQRHMPILSVTTIALILLTGSLAISWQENRGRLQAASKADSLSRFMLNLFDSVTPDSRAGEAFSVNMLLAAGMDRAERELLDEPEVFHQVMHKIAQTYLSLGDKTGVMEAAETIAQYAPLLADDSLFHIDRRHLEATLSAKQGYPQYDLDTAIVRFQEILGELEALPVQDKPRLTRTTLDLGNALNVAGSPDKAELHLRRALSLANQSPVSDPRQIQRQLANTYWSRGQLEESLAMILEVIDGSELWDAGRPSRSQAMNQRTAARIMMRLGDIDDAIKQSEGAVETVRLLYGESDPLYGEFLLNLAVAFDAAGDAQGLLESSKKAADVLAIADPNGASYWRSLKSMGEANRQLGDYTAAIELTAEALRGIEQSDDEWLAITTRYQLAKAQCDAGQYTDSLQTLAATEERLLGNNGRHVGPRLQSNFSLVITTKRIQVLTLQTRFDDALAAAKSALDAHPEFDSSDRLQTINRFRLSLWSAVAYEQMGSTEQARSSFMTLAELRSLLPEALVEEDIRAAEKVLGRRL